jgi:hypothetical protein
VLLHPLSMYDDSAHTTDRFLIQYIQIRILNHQSRQKTCISRNR